MRVFRQILSCLLPLAILCGCDATEPSSAGTMDETNHSVSAVRLGGKVRYPDGRPMAGVRVALGGLSTSTDSLGDWSLKRSGGLTAAGRVALDSATTLTYSYQGQTMREDSVLDPNDSTILRWFAARLVQAAALGSASLKVSAEVMASYGQTELVRVDSVIAHVMGGPWTAVHKMKLSYDSLQKKVSGTIYTPWSPDTAYAYRIWIECWGNGGLAGVSDTSAIPYDSTSLVLPRFWIDNRLPCVDITSNAQWRMPGDTVRLHAGCRWSAASDVVRWEWASSSVYDPNLTFQRGDSVKLHVISANDPAWAYWTVRGYAKDGRWAERTLAIGYFQSPAVAWIGTSHPFRGTTSDSATIYRQYGLRSYMDGDGTGATLSVADSVMRLDVQWANVPAWGAFAGIELRFTDNDHPLDMSFYTELSFEYRTSDLKTALQFAPNSSVYPMADSGIRMLANYGASTSWRKVTVLLPTSIEYMDWMMRDHPDACAPTWAEVSRTITGLIFEPKPYYYSSGDSVVNQNAWVEIRKVRYHSY